MTAEDLILPWSGGRRHWAHRAGMADRITGRSGEGAVEGNTRLRPLSVLHGQDTAVPGWGL